MEGKNYDKVQVMCMKPNIVTTIKGRRLERPGHLLRMSDDRTAKYFWRKLMEEEEQNDPIKVVSLYSG